MTLKQVTLHLADENETVTWARKLALLIEFPFILTFNGEIGMGKTTFIRALLKNLGVADVIKSPTFSLIETYSMGALQIHHIDLYRIEEEGELDHIGFNEYFSPDAITCIEWSDRAQNAIMEVDLDFFFAIKGQGRDLKIAAKSPKGEKLLLSLMGA